MGTSKNVSFGSFALPWTVGFLDQVLSMELAFGRLGSMKTKKPSYQRHRFPSEIISHAVWLYYLSLPSIHLPGLLPCRHKSVTD